MKKFIASLAASLLIVGSVAAKADGYPDYRWGVDHNPYSPYHPSNRYYPGPHYNNRGRNNSKDEWAWALGGLVLGAIIVSSANKERAPERQEDQVTLPPRPKSKVQVCRDIVAYNDSGEPYVLRQCTITEQ